MKQRWKKFSAKFEAISMRERAMVSAACLAGVVFLVNTLMIDPAAKREAALKNTINTQRTQIGSVQQEVALKQQIAALDPDKDAKARLTQMLSDNARMRESLRTMQKGLVAPERMTVLLQQLLGNSRLKLVSLKTMPARGMSDGRFNEADAAGSPTAVVPAVAPQVNVSVLPPPTPGQPAAAAPPKPAKQEELLFRHGVEIVVQGSYLDMLNYMQALEAMPEQLFWGKAVLKADDFPKATLSLTLYTLSLDQKWIAL